MFIGRIGSRGASTEPPERAYCEIDYRVPDRPSKPSGRAAVGAERMDPQLARRVWVAARAAAESWPDSFTQLNAEQFGGKLDAQQVRKAGKALTPPSNAGRRKHGVATPKPYTPEHVLHTAPVRPTVRVDDRALGAYKALLRIPGDWQHRAALATALRRIPGVRQFIELKGKYDLLVIVVAHNEAHADQIRALVQEHVGWATVAFEQVTNEEQDPSPGTWSALARRQVDDEDPT